MANAIEIRALRKSFGRTAALDGLDLEVRTGEAVSYTHLTLPTKA